MVVCSVEGRGCWGVVVYFMFRAGEKGFIPRARVPKAASMDYVKRPKSLVNVQSDGHKVCNFRFCLKALWDCRVILYVGPIWWCTRSIASYRFCLVIIFGLRC